MPREAKLFESAKGSPARALFKLQGDRFGNQLRVELGLVNLLNIDEDFALGFLGQILLELLDLGAFAPDDDARTRGGNGNPQLVAGTIHFDRADAGGLEPVAESVLELQVLAQELGIILLGEPARAPGLGESQPESVRMNLLTHIFALLLHREVGLAIADLDHNVRHSSLITVGAAHGGRPDALHARSFIHVGFGDDQRVHVDIVIAVLGVGDGRTQHFFDGRRDALVGGAQNMDGFPGLLAADQVYHQPRFLRRGSKVSGFGSGLHGLIS